MPDAGKVNTVLAGARAHYCVMLSFSYCSHYDINFPRVARVRYSQGEKLPFPNNKLTPKSKPVTVNNNAQIISKALAETLTRNTYSFKKYCSFSLIDKMRLSCTSTDLVLLILQTFF